MDSGRREVAFYTQVAAAMPAGVVPRCFEAVFEPETGAWHLLLEDLTDSHLLAATWPLPPTTEQCERILHALARLHAEWWDDPRLGVSVGTRLDADVLNQHLQRLEEQYKSFTDRLGDRLSAERRDLYERFLDAAPRLLARYHSQRNFTIAHGDSHVWNYFLPRDGGHDVRLFDCDAWHIGVATGDLAYMMATHWYPERRRRIERPLLDHYHATLAAHGVHGFDRRALDDDYRLSVLWQITTPVRQAAMDLPPLIWWPISSAPWRRSTISVAGSCWGDGTRPRLPVRSLIGDAIFSPEMAETSRPPRHDMNHPQTESSLGFRQDLCDRVRAHLAASEPGLICQFSEDLAASGDPQALLLQARGLLKPFIAFSFAPCGPEMVHVGCVVTDNDHLSIGVHVVRTHMERFATDLRHIADALSLDIRDVEAVNEYQCNFAPIDLRTERAERIAAIALVLCASVAAMVRRADAAHPR